MKQMVIFLLLLANIVLFGQDTVRIQFYPIFQNRILQLNAQNYMQNDTLTIETMKFYLTDITFYKESKPVGTTHKKYHLIDFETPASLILQIYIPQHYDAITFTIGVDSLTNVSGVFGEDLDPTNGMYWTWQTGYINFKMEGKSQHCTSRNKRFQWHIGGYQHPYNTIRQVKLKTKNKNIRIGVFLDELVKQMHITKNYEIMSPNQKAVEISQIISHAFRIYEQ